MTVLRDRLGRLPGGDAALGLLSIAVMVTVLVLGMTGSIGRLFSSSETRTVRAAFADSQQLRPGDSVRIQGIKAGEVTKTELSDDGRSSLVTMKVKRSAGDLYADARAVTRYQTVLGGRFYVDLERGSAGRGPLERTIPATRTGRQTELDDIASVVRGDAKTGLQTLPGELATGLADAHAPARLLEHVAAAAPDLRTGVGALRGQDLDRDLRADVTETSRTVAALDGPRRRRPRAGRRRARDAAGGRRDDGAAGPHPRAGEPARRAPRAVRRSRRPDLPGAAARRA